MQSDPTHSAGILKRLHVLFQSIFAAPQSEDPAGFLYWREPILSSMYLAGTVFGLVVIYPTVSFLIHQRYFLLVTIDILAFLWAIAALLMRGFLPFKLQSVAALTLLYIIGILILVWLGPLSGGFFWIFTFAVSAAVLVGLRSAIVALAINLLSLMAIHAGRAKSIYYANKRSSSE